MCLRFRGGELFERIAAWFGRPPSVSSKLDAPEACSFFTSSLLPGEPYFRSHRYSQAGERRREQ
jgi:hypothetical protein